MVPKEFFGGTRRKLLVLAAALTASTVASIAWGLYVYSHTYHHAATGSTAQSLYSKFIPLFSYRPLVAIANIVTAPHWTASFLNDFLTWNQDWLEDSGQIAVVFVPMVMLVFEKSARIWPLTITKISRLTYAFIFIGTSVLILIAMYFYFNAPFAYWLSKPTRFQGRYFISISAFFFAVFYSNKPFPPRLQILWNKVTNILAIICIIWLNIGQLCSLGTHIH